MNLTDIIQGKSEPSKTEKALKAVYLYLRASDPQQESRGLTVPAQREESLAYANANGITIVSEFVEVQSSFREEKNRPIFMNMVDKVLFDPMISGVLVHEHSRFFRHPYEGPHFKNLFRKHGKLILSATEPDFDPDTIAGLALDKMTEFKNAAYSLDVSFHTKKGMRRNMKTRDHETGFCFKNGGAPPWGFKAVRVDRGRDSRGEPLIKTLWEKNDTIVQGREVWEWTRMVLLDLRLDNGMSYDKIRDFLNSKAIPSARSKHWSTSSIHSLLQENLLLKYAGYGVWNVHGKRGRKKPHSEWIVVPDSHPAILTFEEAQAILDVNQKMSTRSQTRSQKRLSTLRASRSPYALSGGLFTCSRCGANMVGHRNKGHMYYRCGSSAYRKGLGCGKAFYVPKDEIESAVFEEIGHRFKEFADPVKLNSLINAELNRNSSVEETEIKQILGRMKKLDDEMANVRKAVLGGLDDIEWANQELRRLREASEALVARKVFLEERTASVKVDISTVKFMLSSFSNIIKSGTEDERKELAGLFMKGIELDPDKGEVLMHMYKLPPALKSSRKRRPASLETGSSFGMVAGTGFEPATFGL